MFTTSCFIRKNTPELLAKLEQMEYVRALHEEDYNTIGLSVDQGDIFPLRIDDIPILTKEFFIDCGDNEELFFALAALRDDTNNHQWFIAQRTMWDENYNGEITVYYEENEWLMWGHYTFMEDMPSDFRKATVEEILEHFK